MSYSIIEHFKFIGYGYSSLSSPQTDHHPTSAGKRGSYNVGFADDRRDLRAPSPTNSAASKQSGTAVDHSPGAVSYNYKELRTNEHEDVAKRIPWYRTRRGKIGIVLVVLLVVIAAVVGGLMFGSHHSHSSKNSGSNQTGQSSNSTQLPHSSSTSTSLPTSTSRSISSSTSPPSTTSSHSTTPPSSTASTTSTPRTTSTPSTTTITSSSPAVVDITQFYTITFDLSGNK